MMSRIALRLFLTLSFLWLTVVLGSGQPADVQAAQAASPGLVIHVVQPGETLYSIAAVYHISPARLAEANHITDPDSVSPGERLVIPSQPVFGSASGGVSVVVGLDDTLDVLAAQYQTTPHEIALANKVVRADLILAGQALVIPQADPSGSAIRLVRLSASMPLWRVALAGNSNIIALALQNDLSDVSISNPDTLIPAPDTDHPFTALASPWISVHLHSLPLEAGRTGGLTVSVDSPGTVTGTFMSRDLRFEAAGAEYSTVFGIDRWAKPGLYPMLITFTDAAGKASTLTRSVIVVRGNYTSEVVKLTDDAVAARTDPQVAAELAYLTQQMSGYTPQRRWSGMFRIPAVGILTSAFGSVRSINNAGYDSYHAGNDFAATVGTPVYAPADGVVVDTGLLDIRGYSTIIDHGTGVYTGYWHQAGILVKPGDTVVTGQQIGVVGNTGSSTASHLHWEMWVGGVPVDSLQWVREVFP